MEKIRPIDHKLRYQVDKLIRTATTGLSGQSCVCVYATLIYQNNDLKDLCMQ